MPTISRDLQQSSPNFRAQPARSRSKLAEVQQHLVELFNQQQQRNSFEVPQNEPTIREKPERGLMPRDLPIMGPKQEPPQRSLQLTRQNMDIFQQMQQTHQEQENQTQQQQPKKTATAPETVIVQLDGQPSRKVDKSEVAKLKSTIATYELHTKNLVKERDRYRQATRDLQSVNEQLKGEVALIEKSFREVVAKLDEEVRTNRRAQQEHDEVLNKSLRLQHDLSHALEACQKYEQKDSSRMAKIERIQVETEELERQNKELSKQLVRLRDTMNAWTKNTETAPDKSVGQVVMCAVTKIVFCGSVIAVCLAAILNAVQASADVECDYVQEALRD